MVWKNVPKRSKGPGTWPEKKRLEVLQSYILLGNLRQAAALNHVPEVTAKNWKTTTWWKETEDELRRSSKLQLSSKLTDLVNSAMVVIADRLKDGDFVFNPRTGQFIRKPVSAEHANKIAVQLIDRTIAVEKSAQTERVSDEGLEARLQKLRTEMLRFAKAKVITGEFVDVTPSSGLSEAVERLTDQGIPSINELSPKDDEYDSETRPSPNGFDSSDEHSDSLGRVEVPVQEVPESQPARVNPV